MRKHAISTAIAIVLFSSTALAQCPRPVVLPIQNITQQTPEWCWAAAAQQVIASYAGPNQTPQQCALVAMAYGAAPAACCSAYNPACVVPGSMQSIQALIAQFGHQATAMAPPTDPTTLYNTLAAGHPIILHVQSGLSTSHVVVLRGMQCLQTPQGPLPVLLINDPMSYFTQPVSYYNLVPIWLDAIVVY
jgi:hypothetical protein